MTGPNQGQRGRRRWMGEGEDVGRLPMGPSVSLHGLLSGGRPGRKEAPLWLC